MTSAHTFYQNTRPIIDKFRAGTSFRLFSQEIGNIVYPIICLINEGLGPKITGMYLALTDEEILESLSDYDKFKEMVNEAINLIKNDKYYDSLTGLPKLS